MLLPQLPFAIPSPDLILNLSASAAQVLALGAVLIGGLFGRKGKAGARRTRRNRMPWLFPSLFLLTAAGLFLVVLKQRDARNLDLRRNLTRPSVEAGQAVGDVSLKTLGFSDQQAHPLGVESDQLAEWQTEQAALVVVDVREPEEIESGRLSGARQIRYPDLKRDPSLVGTGDSPVLLLCYSGNRSSELASDLSVATGREFRFLVGGYEKWIAEERPLIGRPTEQRRELRELPEFSNKSVLLSTADYEGLLAQEPIVIDVRYPADFATGHLPGARNMPLRAMTTAEIDRELAALPDDRPIVAPVYDKRSAFYAQILGLRLSRLGKDWQGRYTKPREYFMPRVPREHVAQWRANQQTSLLGIVAVPLTALLRWCVESAGAFVQGLLLFVIGLRLAVSPFAWKAERDQHVLRRLKPVLAFWKSRESERPDRFQRRQAGLHRRFRLTPGRNLLGSMLQLVLFLACFVAIRAYLANPSVGVALNGWEVPDPTRVFPFAVGLAALALVVLQAKWSVRRAALGGAFAIFLVVLTWELPRALNLYLVLSLAFLIGQNLLVRASLRRRRVVSQHASSDFPEHGVVSLELAGRHAEAGNKVIRLSALQHLGLPVPDGFVLLPELVERLDQGKLPAESAQAAAAEWKRLNLSSCAVRSSGSQEDGAEQSYAGVFESVLEVEQENFPSALHTVWASLRADRVRAYSGQEAERGSILVQEMVNAEYAGVLFTEHPENAAASVIEFVAGLGEDLVSGRATPKTHLFGRITGQCLDAEKADLPLDFAPLLELGRIAEEGFGKPQDIEWAYADGKFYLLQSRDITTLLRDHAERGAWEADRRRLWERLVRAEGETEPLVQDSIAELLPEPTPMSFSLMSDLWEADGAVEQASLEMGIPYEVFPESQPMLLHAFGRVFTDEFEQKQRMRKGISALSSFQLTRKVEQYEEDFREEFLVDFRRRVDRRAWLDFRQASVADLVTVFSEWRREFTQENYTQAEKINLLAEFCMRSARAAVEKHGLDAAQLFGDTEETVVARAYRKLHDADSVDQAVAEFVRLFGHRSPHDFEISEARFGEDLERVQAMAERAARMATRVEGQEARKNGSKVPLDLKPTVRVWVERARRMQVLKEEAKHELLLQFAQLRRVLLELDARAKLNGKIFYLHANEIGALVTHEGRALMRERAGVRRRVHRRALRVDLPTTRWSANELERFDPKADSHTVVVNGDAWQGTRIAGLGGRCGRARVLTSADQIDQFERGEILVARFTDPSFAAVFPLAGGIVTEVGGWLSHAAIQAREFDITGIVGATGVVSGIRSGDLIQLNEDGGVCRVVERRTDPRVERWDAVSVEVEDRAFPGTLCDQSERGLGIECKETQLQDGQSVAVLRGSERVNAKVVRVGRDQRFGLMRTD